MPSPLLDDHLPLVVDALAGTVRGVSRRAVVSTIDLARTTGSPARYIERIGSHFLTELNRRLRRRRMRASFEAVADQPAVFHVRRDGR